MHLTLVARDWLWRSRDMFFNFSGPFEVHDDNEVLRRMGLQNVRLH
jgi:hypothetical protein